MKTYLWIVHSGFCVVYFGVFVFVLYLWIVHSGLCCVLQCVCLLYNLERYRTKTNTLKYTTQNPECTIQRYRTKTNTLKYTTQNPECTIPLDCTFWILCCVLRCACLRSISLDCTFWILCCVLRCVCIRSISLDCTFWILYVQSREI
jgi:hypothetical protein